MRILAPQTFLTTTISSPSVSGGCVMLNPAALASIASSILSMPHTSLSRIATLMCGVQPWSVLVLTIEAMHILTVVVTYSSKVQPW
jgi:L-lysine 2,3-aminomutase